MNWIAKSDVAPVDFVDQTPDKALYTALTECPFCASKDVKNYSTGETLVGGGREANHEWRACRCGGCGEKFIREDAHGQTWYTKDSKILKGYPNCFEDYTYTHRDCGGDVKRRYTALNGIDAVKSLHTKYIDDKPARQYRTFYDCSKCAATVEFCA